MLYLLTIFFIQICHSWRSIYQSQEGIGYGFGIWGGPRSWTRNGEKPEHWPVDPGYLFPAHQLIWYSFKYPIMYMFFGHPRWLAGFPNHQKQYGGLCHKPWIIKDPVTNLSGNKKRGVGAPVCNTKKCQSSKSKRGVFTESLSWWKKSPWKETPKFWRLYLVSSVYELFDWLAKVQFQ